MKYDIASDITIICKILNLSYAELANELGVARSTVSRIVNGDTYPSDLFLEAFYSFAYKNNYQNVRINELKIQYAKEKCKNILFHGAREPIDGEIDLVHSRADIDIGVGFYLGESYEQSSSYIFPYKRSSVYLFDITELSKLRVKEYEVSLEWMLVVSYFRGQIEDYKDTSTIQKIIQELSNYDIIIAPIADNNMYEMMNQFARGEITDLQAINALSASYLGKQHVLKNIKACQSVKMVNRLYLCKEEREEIEIVRRENALNGMKKAKAMIEQYRRQGKYIEEILK